jgi:23S rRNA pseudouridine1911/1915/1917 synthase
MRLIDHLKTLGHSNRDAQKLLRSGKVWYRGAPTADPIREIMPADITLRLRAPRIRTGLDPAVLWHDRHMAIIWKPPGLLSVAAPGRWKENNLVSLMARHFGQAHPVHRLDEPTSGVMMVALDEATQLALKELLARHDIERRYLAIVRGVPQSPEATVSNHLVEDRGDGRRGSGRGPGSKAATTHFRLVEQLGKHHALVEARLETGRTHQVRIHLSESGLPVLGDSRYADAAVTRAAPRLALHAWRLGLTHPKTGEQLRFEAPLADDLERVRRQLSGVGARRGR